MKNKKCKKCLLEKDINDFYFYKSKNYRDGFCKKCRNENNKNWRRTTQTKNEFYIREKLLKSNKNICFVCKEIKPLKAFYESNHVNTGYHNTCKKCMKVADKNNKLKSTYGITLDDYNKMFDKQKGLCAICKTELHKKQKDTCVDHCHKTNTVRGLLCNSCNRGLGLLGDSKIKLYSAIRYLKSSSE